jgi:orotidine-5'-phosphate decarboxylase
MDARNRLIVALDGVDLTRAERLIAELAPYVGMFKVGFEQIARQQARTLAEHAASHGVGVFYDGKFHDIPQTVANASGIAAAIPAVQLFNVHCSGGSAMMAAAARAAVEARQRGNRPKVLGVTVLTSMDAETLAEVGLSQKGEDDPVVASVVHFARLAQASGLDGVVASPREIETIRAECGPEFCIVTPGVRPAGTALGDQIRVATPGEAIRRGADYLVVGRPITRPENGSPTEAAQRIVDEIAAVV